MVLKVAKRGTIPPFIVMDVMREANEREAQGEDVLHLEVGQPGTGAPGPVLEAEKAALEQRVAEAFTQGDRKEGGRIARQLEQQSERLEELYAKWLREESSRAT